MKAIQNFLLIVIFNIFIYINASADACIYIGPNGGDWNVASNWSCVDGPNSCDVYIDNGKEVILSTSTTVRSINIRDGSLTITESGSLSIDTIPPSIQGGNFFIDEGIVNNYGSISIKNALNRGLDIFPEAEFNNYGHLSITNTFLSIRNYGVIVNHEDAVILASNLENRTHVINHGYFSLNKSNSLVLWNIDKFDNFGSLVLEGNDTRAEMGNFHNLDSILLKGTVVMNPSKVINEGYIIFENPVLKGITLLSNDSLWNYGSIEFNNPSNLPTVSHKIDPLYFNASSGVINGSGYLHNIITNNGTLSPGDASTTDLDTLVWPNSYTSKLGSNISINIYEHQNDLFHVSNNASFSDTLTLTLIGEVPLSEERTIITCGGTCNGIFETIHIKGNPNLLGVNIVYEQNVIKIMLDKYCNVTEPVDYNPIPNNAYRSDQILLSSGRIPSGGYSVFSSDTSILLNPGFNVQLFGELEAIIDDCVELN